MSSRWCVWGPKFEHDYFTFGIFIHEIGHTLNMHHDYAFNRGHNPYNENSFENKKLSTYVLNVECNICMCIM